MLTLHAFMKRLNEHANHFCVMPSERQLFVKAKMPSCSLCDIKAVFDYICVAQNVDRNASGVYVLLVSCVGTGNVEMKTSFHVYYNPIVVGAKTTSILYDFAASVRRRLRRRLSYSLCFFRHVVHVFLFSIKHVVPLR